jgi:hypothetical protein
MQEIQVTQAQVARVEMVVLVVSVEPEGQLLLQI